nr:unnamed protein product [Spirometra erinaceieuropaei]
MSIFDERGCLTPDSSLALSDCTNMERKYWGLHRSTMHNMTKRAKMAYYAATDDPSLPSTSSLVTESSPEPSMPHLSPEVSIDDDQVADDSSNPFSGNCFLTDLREFCLSVQLPQATFKLLFQFLRKYHPEVPKDPRTLMQTPRACVTESLSNGSYVHLGLKRGLLDELQLRPSALQIDGVAMGSSLGPLLANAFMRKLEGFQPSDQIEKLKQDGRYADDIFRVQPRRLCKESRPIVVADTVTECSLRTLVAD